MAPDLGTTNLFLGIMAVVSLLHVAGFLALTAGAVYLSRRVVRLIVAVEKEQIAPAGARVQAILDDVKDVTTTIKTNARGIDSLIGRIFR